VNQAPVADALVIQAELEAEHVQSATIGGWPPARGS
jgi:hypothetical protein